MIRRATTLTLAFAVVLTAAGSTVAFADGSRGGPSASKSGRGSSESHRQDEAHRQDKPERAFVYAGTLSAVNPADSTITFTIRRGDNKALRGLSVNFTVPAQATITRDDAAATLADFRVGDVVRVKALRSAGGGLTLARLTGSTAPAPTTQPTPEPTTTPSPTPTTPPTSAPATA